MPVLSSITTTRPTAQLKNVTDPEERRSRSKASIRSTQSRRRDAAFLLFDDLFRSGTTMNAITDELLGPGKAAAVAHLLSQDTEQPLNTIFIGGSRHVSRLPPR